MSKKLCPLLSTVIFLEDEHGKYWKLIEIKCQKENCEMWEYNKCEFKKDKINIKSGVINDT